MSAFLFYKVESDHARAVTDFLHDFEKRTGKTLEVVDPDSPRGENLRELYDVMMYPTIIATDDDGRLKEAWRGEPMPLIDEVSFYV
jgi:hypothetical protein